MSINPANATAVQTALLHERHDFCVGDHRCPMHGGQIRQELPPCARIADQQLAVDQLMPADLAPTKKHVERVGIWPTPRHEADPYRRVNEHRHAADRFDFVRAVVSRRRGMSVARGSVPRSARSRS